MPEWIVSYLDGNAIHSKAAQAIALSTVDEAGWPHSAMLSLGELLAIDETTIRVVLWPKSQTSANIQRDPRFTLTIAGLGSLTELRFQVARIETEAAQPLLLFEATLVSIRTHEARYAQVLAGITFQLHPEQQPEVLARWAHQIGVLRRLTSKGI